MAIHRRTCFILEVVAQAPIEDEGNACSKVTEGARSYKLGGNRIPLEK